MKNLIGRIEERNILIDCLNSDSSELVAVYGRRRVGKTFLVRKVFEEELCFDMIGQHHASLSEQLENFSRALAKRMPSRKTNLEITSWQGAFRKLEEYLSAVKSKKKKVIFFDELPWLDTSRSGFLSALEYFWNSFAAQRDDIVLVICGSAASWMIKKVINNKGGLHNRVTKKLPVYPFSLKETESFLQAKGIHLNRNQIVKLYMVMGGIPFYLDEVKKGMSVDQNIQKICFDLQGLLYNEFNNLYAALFDGYQRHINIIRALAKNKKGLTRDDIFKLTKLSTGGTNSYLLEELVASGFISVTVPLNNKTKQAVYRLKDEYSLFYLKFIDANKGKMNWQQAAQKQSWKIWAGYAFENICLYHIRQIKASLGIASVFTQESAWCYKAASGGAQIDMLIDRADQCINVCEMKFYDTPFEISKGYAKELEHKLNLFKMQSKTRKTIFLTLITANGLVSNKYSVSMVANSITADELFSPITI